MNHAFHSPTRHPTQARKSGPAARLATVAATADQSSRRESGTRTGAVTEVGIVTTPALRKAGDGSAITTRPDRQRSQTATASASPTAIPVGRVSAEHTPKTPAAHQIRWCAARRVPAASARRSPSVYPMVSDTAIGWAQTNIVRIRPTRRDHSATPSRYISTPASKPEVADTASDASAIGMPSAATALIKAGNSGKNAKPLPSMVPDTS